MDESSRDIDIRRLRNLLTTSVNKCEREKIQRLLIRKENETAVQEPQR